MTKVEQKEEGEHEGESTKEDDSTNDVPASTENDETPKSPSAGEKRKRDFESGSEMDNDSRDQSEAPRSPDSKPIESPTDGEKEGEEKKEEDEAKEKEEAKEEKNGEPQPRELHRTASIFLRNLAPTITKLEVEAVSQFKRDMVESSVKVDSLQMCKRYQGFLRAAIADPQPERRWFRRGWVTFERNVNIKEICWNLNNIRVLFIFLFRHDYISNCNFLTAS